MQCNAVHVHTCEQMKHCNIKHIFGPFFLTMDADLGRPGYRKSEWKPGFLFWLTALGQLWPSYDHVWQPEGNEAGGQTAFGLQHLLGVVDALDERFYLLFLPNWFSPLLKINVSVRTARERLPPASYEHTEWASQRDRRTTFHDSSWTYSQTLTRLWGSGNASTAKDCWSVFQIKTSKWLFKFGNWSLSWSFEISPASAEKTLLPHWKKHSSRVFLPLFSKRELFFLVNLERPVITWLLSDLWPLCPCLITEFCIL